MISEVNRLYRKTDISIKVEEVSSDPVTRLAMSIRELKSEVVANYQGHEDVTDLVFLFRKILYKITTGLLDYNEILRSEDKDELRASLSLAYKSYPSLFDAHLKKVGNSLKSVLETEGNPLIERVIDSINDQRFEMRDMSVAVVTKKSLIEEERYRVASHLRLTTSVSFFTENGFRVDTEDYDKVIYIGSPNHCGMYATNTFKSESVTFITYDFYDNSFVKRETLNRFGEDRSISTVYEDVEIEQPSMRKKTLLMPPTMEPSELLNRFIMKAQKENQDEDPELIEAMVVYLENNHFIFIPRDVKVKTLTSEGEVNDTKVESIDEGSYIIVRNKSESKLIGEVADEFFLKDRRDEFRDLQLKWKERLIESIKEYGVDRFSYLLRTKHSITYANPIIIKTWIKEETIAPRAIEKLLPALKYDEAEIEETLIATKEIRSAHLKAGRLISKSIMDAISPEMIEIVKERGFHTFESEEFTDVTFNIERVIYIDNEVREVATSQLMKLYKLI